MAIDFFDHEVARLQDRFNDTFGNRNDSDLRTLGATFMSVLSIGLLARKINKATDKAAVRPEIQEFMYCKKVMDKFFDRNINPTTERSNHGTVGKRSNDERRTAV